MRSLLLAAMLASGCTGEDGLAFPGPPPSAAPCCVERDGQLVCHDSKCPELAHATECTTLADTNPHYCQVPITDDCQAVYLEHTPSYTGAPFQTVYCFADK